MIEFEADPSKFMGKLMASIFSGKDSSRFDGELNDPFKLITQMLSKINSPFTVHFETLNLDFILKNGPLRCNPFLGHEHEKKCLDAGPNHSLPSPLGKSKLCAPPPPMFPAKLSRRKFI